MKKLKDVRTTTRDMIIQKYYEQCKMKHTILFFKWRKAQGTSSYSNLEEFIETIQNREKLIRESEEFLFKKEEEEEGAVDE
jgi:hypothetical protein